MTDGVVAAVRRREQAPHPTVTWQAARRAARCLALRLAKRPAGLAPRYAREVSPKAKLQKRRALLHRLRRLFVILSFAKNLVFVPTHQE